MDEARNRLVAAALRYASAERGGLDSDNHDGELELAEDILTDAVRRYNQALLEDEKQRMQKRLAD